MYYFGSEWCPSFNSMGGSIEKSLLDTQLSPGPGFKCLILIEIQTWMNTLCTLTVHSAANDVDVRMFKY